MKETVRIGYIGLGRRGRDVLQYNLCLMKDVDIATICDLSTASMEKAREFIEAAGKPTPKMTTDYHDILNDPTIDAVFIMTPWSGRVAMAMESMRAGKYTTMEVGCADRLEECFDLVRTYEETGVPVMMLENCCYGRREMMLLNMVKQGLFGEVVHCAGGYLHYLNEVELFKGFGTDENHYRLNHYIHDNRESYPTHELGPICKIMGINRGNRIVSLSSFSSKSAGLKDYAARHLGANSAPAQTDYRQGDIVNTVLTCADGATILLTLDTTLPRSHYSRGLSVRGTRGMSFEDRRVIFLDGMEEDVYNNEESLYGQYDHPLHAEYARVTVEGSGHGGIDYLACRAFIESVKNGTQTPIDVYDTATWLAVGPLSAESIANGSVPVKFPDFTSGKWEHPGEPLQSKYSLDAVCTDESVSII